MSKLVYIPNESGGFLLAGGAGVGVGGNLEKEVLPL